MISRYDYKELKQKVLENETEENLNALGEWFEMFGNDFWNGEYFDADDFHLVPIYKEVDEDEFERIGWEIR